MHRHRYIYGSFQKKNLSFVDAIMADTLNTPVHYSGELCQVRVGIVFFADERSLIK